MEKVLLYIFITSALCDVASLAEPYYYFIYEPKTWADAQSYCRDKFTDLVTVDSLDVAATLNNLVDLKQMGVARDAWIGLYEDIQSWRWSLVDDTFYQGYSTQYRNWAAGLPDNYASNEPCSEMLDTGEWNDISCMVNRKPLCVSVSSQTVKFVAVNLAMTWRQAQNYCRTHYTDLASVRSIEENSGVLAVKPKGEAYWLGLYRDAWKWSDGHENVMSYWSANQPAGATEHCATTYFTDAGRFRDWLCSYTKPFICYGRAPYTKHVLKIKLVRNSIVDLNDAAVQTDLLNKLKQKLQENSVQGELSLSWKKQVDGKIFYKEQKED